MTQEEIIQALHNMTEAKLLDASDAANELSQKIAHFDMGTCDEDAQAVAENFIKLQNLLQNPRNICTGQDYYYQYTDGTEYTRGFWFVTKEYFDNEGYLNDQYDEELNDLLPDEFYALQEACYGYHGDHSQAKKWLDDNGFVCNKRLMG